MSLLNVIGKSPSLFIKNKSFVLYKKSWIPLFVLLLFFISCFIFLGIDIFQRKKPSIVSNRSFAENPGELILGPSTLNFGCTLKNRGSQPHYDPSIYKMTFSQRMKTYIEDEDGKIAEDIDDVPLKHRKCTYDDFPDAMQGYNKEILSNYRCIDPIQPSGIQPHISGRWINKYFAEIMVEVEPCVNDTSTEDAPVCQDPEIVQYQTNNVAFECVYLNNEFNPNNFDIPVLSNHASQYTQTSELFVKYLNFKIENHYIDTDSGWIGTDIKKDHFYTIHPLREIITSHEDNKLLGASFQFEQYNTFYKRDYIKVADILAQADGVFSIGLIVILFLYYPRVSSLYYQTVFDELYAFKDDRATLKTKKSLQRALSFQENDFKLGPKKSKIHSIDLGIIASGNSRNDLLRRCTRAEINKQNQEKFSKDKATDEESCEINQEENPQNEQIPYFSKDVSPTREAQPKDIIIDLDFRKSDSTNSQDKRVITFKPNSNGTPKSTNPSVTNTKFSDIPLPKESEQGQRGFKLRAFEQFISVYSPNKKAKRKSEIYNLYQSANRKLRQEADICTIIKQQREFEILKKLLLNQDQLNLLEQLKNQKVKIDENTGSKKHREHEEQRNERYFRSFVNLLNKEDKTELDERLLQAIDDVFLSDQ